MPTELKTQTVEIDRLHANPWNPNQQNEVVAKAERESIATFGFIDPLTVRAHPEMEGHFQIIDGEHRWKASQDLELNELPVVVIDVDDPTAKKLTIVLNETRGDSDVVALGTLLADIQKNVDETDFPVALPFTDREVEHFLSLADVDWGKFGGDLDDQEPPPTEADEWFSLHARCPQGFQEVWAEVLEHVEIEHDDPQVRAGLVIEAMCAEYLAGVRAAA